MKTAQLIRLLGNWNTLNEDLLSLKEPDVVQLLEYEKKHANRITFVLRIHSRLNKMRRERERRVIAKGII